MYTPGSFSKNYGWHGEGFLKLHVAIKTGFNKKLEAVSRDLWREQTESDDKNDHLIPLNFFLYNRDNQLCVDELVYCSIKKEHSLDFDRLALFAFHLNRVGKPPRNGPQRPSMWANEFVIEKLWKNGSWYAESLSIDEMDSFIGTKLDAVSLKKCRSNYRHFFELGGYLEFGNGIINTDPEGWINSALFLAWDRFVLDGGNLEHTDLLSYLRHNEIYKLIGIDESTFEDFSATLVDTYIGSGGLRRFIQPMKKSKDESPSLDINLDTLVEWDAVDSLDETVERRVIQQKIQLRDRKKVSALKKLYKNECIFCGVQLKIGNNKYYSEAAHIKPIGEPHNGPDKTSNMVVLCPNHHKQFDKGALRIKKVGNTFKAVSSTENDPLDHKVLPLKHEVSNEYIEWHYRWFSFER